MTNEEADLVRATVQAKKIAYPVALTEGAAADRAYGVTAVPRSFLIDRKGDLVWAGHPAAIDEALIEELLADR